MTSELSFVLILVTPAHLSLMGEQRCLARRVLAANYKVQAAERFNTLTVVVDRLPGPTYTKNSERGERDDLHDKEAKNICGYDGLAICLLKPEAAPEIWAKQNRALKKPQDPMFPGTLNFTVDISNTETQTVQMPVASTLFHNGRPGTMLLQYWQCSGDSEKDLVEKRRTYLRTADIYLIQGCRDRVDSAFRTRIKPITPKRTVMASAGNILRTISGPSGTVPASSELESNINGLISSGEMKREQTQVWALVQKEPCIPVTDSASLEQALKDGARLHKVLSGGGGWGHKKGLVALNPMRKYEMEPSSNQEEDMVEFWDAVQHDEENEDFDGRVWLLDEDGIERAPTKPRQDPALNVEKADQLSRPNRGLTDQTTKDKASRMDGAKGTAPFPRLVESGSSITFCIYDVPPADTPTPLRTVNLLGRHEMPVSAAKDTRYLFGTVPPLTENALEAQPVQEQGISKHNFARKFFGMLTERGMSFTNEEVFVDGRRAQLIFERPGDFSTSVVVSSTMIDVPFSKLSIVRRGGERAPSVIASNHQRIRIIEENLKQRGIRVPKLSPGQRFGKNKLKGRGSRSQK